MIVPNLKGSVMAIFSLNPYKQLAKRLTPNNGILNLWTFSIEIVPPSVAIKLINAQFAAKIN